MAFVFVAKIRATEYLFFDEAERLSKSQHRCSQF